MHIFYNRAMFFMVYTQNSIQNVIILVGIVGNAHLSFDSGEIRIWGELIWTDYNLPRA